MEISEELIITKIYHIRTKKVMLDRDLAELYGVPTRALKQQVRRNLSRFPEDFMFELSKEEFENWRSQFVTSNSDKMGLRIPPFAFTEQGVAMLSSILSSEIAVKVNIQIIRIFTKLREMLSTHKDILLKLEQIEKRMYGQEENIQILFEAIRQLVSENEQPRKEIGYTATGKR